MTTRRRRHPSGTCQHGYPSSLVLHATDAADVDVHTAELGAGAEPAHSALLDRIDHQQPVPPAMTPWCRVRSWCRGPWRWPATTHRGPDRPGLWRGPTSRVTVAVSPTSLEPFSIAVFRLLARAGVAPRSHYTTRGAVISRVGRPTAGRAPEPRRPARRTMVPQSTVKGTHGRTSPLRRGDVATSWC